MRTEKKKTKKRRRRKEDGCGVSQDRGGDGGQYKT